MAATVVQNVVIDVTVQDDSVKSATDRLAAMGTTEAKNAEEFKKANAQILAQAKALETITKAQGGTVAGSNNLKRVLQEVVTTLSKMGAGFRDEFAKGAKDALMQAGVSAEEFEQALKGIDQQEQKVVETSKSLKAQLREMVAELARMKVAGQDNSQEFTELAQKAGALKDAIGDASAEVDRFASDTSTFDGLISAVSGLAGGYAVVQGAQALFGEESEELQKTLLKVNAAMAILQGLQQIQTVLQKESAAATLASTIATKAQTFAQTALTFVVGTSTGALKLFRIALAATGVGLLVVGIIALYEALQDSNDELEKANELIEDQNRRLESNIGLLNRRADISAAEAELAGASESKIQAIRGRSLLAQREATISANANLASQRDALDRTSEAWNTLNNSIEENNAKVRDIDTQLILADLAYRKQLADEAKDAAEKAKAAREKAAVDAKKARQKEFEDFKAYVELELLASKEGSEEQLAARKRLLNAELQLALNNEELTLNQRRLLIQQFFRDSLKLTTDYTKEQSNLFREAAISEANTALQQLEISRTDRLLATEQTIKEQASIEIAAAEGNAVKIREIAAKRDADIRAARLASLEATLEYELALEKAENGTDNRRLQAIAADAETELAIRIDALEEIAEIESASVRKRIGVLNEERQKGLISEEDYNLKYAQLVDQNREVWENVEKSKTEITEAEAKKREERIKQEIQTAVDTAQQVVAVFAALSEETKNRENARIDEAKERIKELQDAGAITEKEAISRTKRVEAEEKRVRQQQAQRDKAIAVFNATLAIPGAILKGLAQGGPILAAVYGALATVQATIVASRRLPQFGKGKSRSNKYEGLAEVGETGTELIEHNGRMYVADRRMMTWVGRDTIVHNPQETKRIMSHQQPSVPGPVMNAAPTAQNRAANIDYEKMGKEIGKHLKPTDVYVDGVHAQRIYKDAIEKYQYSRRNFGR